MRFLLLTALLILVACHRTEPEKLVERDKRRVEATIQQKLDQEQRARTNANLYWFHKHELELTAYFTNIAFGIKPGILSETKPGTPSTPTPTVTLAGRVENATDRRIDFLLLDVSILNPKFGDKLVYTERLALAVDVFPTAGGDCSATFLASGSELLKCVQQIKDWAWRCQIVTAIPHGDIAKPEDFGALTATPD